MYSLAYCVLLIARYYIPLLLIESAMKDILLEHDHKIMKRYYKKIITLVAFLNSI
jgi:hypothetical protein